MVEKFISRLGVFGSLALVGGISLALGMWGEWPPSQLIFPLEVQFILGWLGDVFLILGIYHFMAWGQNTEEKRDEFRLKWGRIFFFIGYYLFLGISIRLYFGVYSYDPNTFRHYLGLASYLVIALGLTPVLYAFVVLGIRSFKKRRNQKTIEPDSEISSLDSLANATFHLVVLPSRKLRVTGSEMPVGPEQAAIRIDGLNDSDCKKLYFRLISVNYSNFSEKMDQLNIDTLNPTDDLFPRKIPEKPYIVSIMEASGRVANFVFSGNNFSDDMPVGFYGIEIGSFYFDLDGNPQTLTIIKGVLEIRISKGFAGSLYKRLRWKD